MPQLLVFAMGRQVVVDKDTSLVSIVSIFSGFTAQKQKDDLEPNGAVPIDWGCAAVFKRTQEDEGKVYELQFRLTLPDGTVNYEGSVPFSMSGLTHSMVVRGADFPASQGGTYLMTASLREYDTEADWEEVGRYPIDVIYLPAKESEVLDEQ